MAGRTIVVGDIHGCYDELVELLDKLSLRDEDRLVAVGDLVVKGEKSREVLDLFMSDARLSSVLGNHDLALLRFWRGEPVELNGGQKRCAREFEPGGGRYAGYLASLPLIVDLGSHLVVHAGLRPGVPVENQTIEDLTELRTLGGDPAGRRGVKWYEEYDGEKVVLFGHWPKRGPRRGPRALGLDTGCVYGGELTAYVVETGELVSVRARKRYDPPAKERIVLKSQLAEEKPTPVSHAPAKSTAKAKKIVEGLDCESDVREAARVILRAHFEEFCGLRPRALDPKEAEGAGEMRAALRRLCGAAREFEPHLPRPVAGERLQRVAFALDAVGDAEVAVAGWKFLAKKARKKEGEEVATGVKELARELKKRRARARAELGSQLADEAFEELRGDFGARLKGAAPRPGEEVSGAGASFEASWRGVVLARVRELRERGLSLYRPFEPEPLRRLLDSSRQSRDALDLFAQCRGGRCQAFADDVAALQKSLEALRHRDVWIEDLGARLAAGGLDAGARRAAFWLLGRLVKERAKHYRAALALWEGWERAGFFERLKAELEIPR